MTPKERAAMQQALEALEIELEAETCEEFADAAVKCDEAITALREALDHFRDATKMVALTAEQAQQIEEALHKYVLYCDCMDYEHAEPALATIRAARAQEPAEQEPVAYQEKMSGVLRYGKINDSDTPLYAAPQPVTTPDVCGEICERAKLCYGCGMALDEANRIHEERFDYELDNAPFRGMGEVSPSTKLYMKELQETLSEKADRKHVFSSECPKCGHKVISTHTGEVWWCPKCQHEWPCEKQAAKQPVQKVDLTDDEIEALWMDADGIALCRAVIAADREKNK